MFEKSHHLRQLVICIASEYKFVVMIDNIISSTELKLLILENKTNRDPSLKQIYVLLS